MILTYAGSRLLKVHIDHPDTNRGAELWKLADRIEELDCWYRTRQMFSFLSSLGPVSSLKVFRLHGRIIHGQQWYDLPVIFRGHLPSLRELRVMTTVTWPLGFFRGLRFFEFGSNPEQSFSRIHVLDVLRKCPLLEDLRLAGHLDPYEDDPSPVALQSLRSCTLIGNGALSLIWYMEIPASTNVHISTSALVSNNMEIYSFRDLCLAPLHVLDEVSTASFTIGFDTIQLRVQNDSGGVLSIQVYRPENAMIGLTILSMLLKGIFHESPSKFQTTKEASLSIEQGSRCGDTDSVSFTAIFSKFISRSPSLERIKLCGVPAKTLSFHLGCLHNNLDVMVQFPNLQQLHIETPLLYSAKSLLEDLHTLLRRRNDSGVPLQFVAVKVSCETLIPMAEHSAFLTAWESLVREDVKVEYSRGKVKYSRGKAERLPWRLLGLVANEGEEECDGSGIVESSGDNSDWESWNSGQWPKTASEMRRRTGTS